MPQLPMSSAVLPQIVNKKLVYVYIEAMLLLVVPRPSTQ